MSEPIAIVGMACRFPGADDVEDFWGLIRAGKVTAAPVSPARWRDAGLYRPDDPRFADGAYSNIVAHLSDVATFDAQRYNLPPRRVEVMDPQHRLLVDLTDAALRDADLADLPRDRTGVYIGASATEYKDILSSRVRARQLAAGEFGKALPAELARAAVEGIAAPRAYSTPGTLLNMGAAAVSSAFDLGGPSFVVDAACASSLVALHEAIIHLRAGVCDVAVVGGVYLNLVPDNLVGFSRIGALSRAGVCRPFDRRADGFVVGEGAAVVVLTRGSDAERDQNLPHATILGTGCANDGRAEGPMTPRLEGQVASLRRAYADAGVDPATVEYIECHGTATPAGDAVELAALHEVFGADSTAQIGSVKANIGHTMAPAGLAGLIKSVLMLRDATVPPQASFDEPDPALGTLRVARQAKPWQSAYEGRRRAGISAFGFGGTNVHAIIEEVPARERTTPAAPARPQTRYWAITRGSAPTETTTPEPLVAPAETTAPAPAVSTVDALLACIATVGAYPLESLDRGQSLVDDLGFDSLMVVELELVLADTFPAVTALPKELLTRTTTVAEVADWLDQHGGPAVAATPASAAPGDPAVARLPELAELHQRFELGARLGLDNPYFISHDGALGATTHVNGRELIDFSGYDYLGLATDPVVVDAAREAVLRFGTSVSASRVISGERPAHRELEAAIADLHGVEAALAMVSGHATNVSVLGHLLRPGDLALHDSLAHDSIIQGLRLSGAKRQTFPHNDLAALERFLKELGPRHRRVFVAVEGVYSMDGDLADLPALVRLRRQYGFLLYVDEAHSVGVLGEHGRGAGEHWGIQPSDVDIWMGTLSKALASCGGYVAGGAELIEYLRYTTPGFVYSVGMPPAVTAAAVAAVRRLGEVPERVARLRDNTDLFRRLAASVAGVNIGPGGGAVVPVVVGSSAGALVLSDRMRQRGINVAPILYPAVEEEAARLRFFINATHTAEHITTTVNALADELPDLGMLTTL